MKRVLYTLLLAFGLLASAWADGSRYASGSVLSSGRWVKIRVAEDGVYKLTAADLKKMGFSDLGKVAVYGYGGWPLDEDFSTTYVDDVPEVAVWRNADYLLFYGKGPRKWEYVSSDGAFVHTNNPYSNFGYYFVTEKGDAGKTMEKASAGEGATLQVTTFDDYILHEQDLVSVNSSGRELYGESFVSTLSRDFTVSVPGITNEEGKVSLSFIARASGGMGNVTMSVDGKSLISGSFSPPTGSSADYVMATERKAVTSWTGSKGESVKVNIQYNTTGHRNVHLNYFRLQMKRELKIYGSYTFFRSLAARGNASRFTLQGADANTLVFDVTDGINPLQMETSLSGSELSFTIPASSALREFVAVKPSQIKTPETVGEVTNQNLHALSQQDMIVIAPSAFTTQAERLAEAHRTMDGLTVQVVTPETIYNEFSSGTPDATAYRRFMKMFYDRRTSDADAPKYLLLFGDGSYDNRQLTASWRSLDMTNMLLTYQTENSLNYESFVIDDYFGFLDDADNSKALLQNKKVCLGIGRFPIRTTEQAAQMVDKVITYMENKNTGTWKNNLCFIADDGNNSDGYMTEHMSFADQLADYMESSHPEFLVDKLYYDAYKKDLTAGTYPDVQTNLQKLLKDGLLLLNYTGHGGTTALSDEKVVTQTDIAQYSYSHLPVWITATCDFTRFDDLNTSAGEDVFLNRNSGGIALFTTVRVAYSRPNFPINNNMIRNLFERENGRRRTLGEVIKATKNHLSSINKLGFCLIGDPAMKLAYPEYNMKVTSVNGQSVDGAPISFKALGKITVEGEVVDGSGTLVSDFTGIVNPTVKDSKVTVTCLNNNGQEGDPFTYTDYPNTLFVGNDSVRNGRFSFTFTVPKDISYSNLQGKMNLYAVDTEKGAEAHGNFNNFTVGGTSGTAETDTVGPEIRALYLNDTTFVDGGQVNTTPYFVARLWDKSGVNITGSSVGHDMMLTIDESAVLSYNLNSYYELQVGEEGAGIVKFSIPALEPGKHTAEFRVWDIQNNSTVQTFTFEVVEGLKPYLFDVIATPTLAREQVTFHISHNRPESRMRVGIMVYDLAGRRLWMHEESGSSDLFEDYTVSWDLTHGGSRLRPGVYIYRAAISTDNSKEATKARKLIVLSK